MSKRRKYRALQYVGNKTLPNRRTKAENLLEIERQGFQNILERYDKLFMMWKGWAIGIASAATGFALKESDPTLLYAGILAMIMFYIVEMAYRVVTSVAQLGLMLIRDEERVRNQYDEAIREKKRAWTSHWVPFSLIPMYCRQFGVLRLHYLVPIGFFREPVHSRQTISRDYLFGGRGHRKDFIAWFFEILPLGLKPRAGLPYFMIIVFLIIALSFISYQKC